MLRGIAPLAGLAGVALAGLVLLTGCGGGSAEDFPAGFTRVYGDVVEVDHPRDWKRGDPGAAGESVTYVARKGASDAQVAVLEKPVKASTASLAASALGAGRVAGQTGKTTKRAPAEVEGADEALRVDYTYTMSGAGGRGIGMDLVAVRDREVFVVRVTGVQGRLDPGTVDAIAASMKLKEPR